jgi:hypothetical protein
MFAHNSLVDLESRFLTDDFSCWCPFHISKKESGREDACQSVVRACDKGAELRHINVKLFHIVQLSLDLDLRCSAGLLELSLPNADLLPVKISMLVPREDYLAKLRCLQKILRIETVFTKAISSSPAVGTRVRCKDR